MSSSEPSRQDSADPLRLPFDLGDEDWFPEFGTPRQPAEVSETDRSWLAALDRFIDSHGHGAVPKRYVDEEGRELGAWVAEVLRAFQHGEFDVALAEALNQRPGWSRTAADVRWDERFHELETVARETGTGLISADFVTPSGVRLGSWVSRQLSAAKRGKLAGHRRQQLETLLGWQWHAAAISKVAVERISEIRDHVQRHGPNATLPPRLRRWTQSQDRLYQNGRLSFERFDALVEAGWGVWRYR